MVRPDRSSSLSSDRLLPAASEVFRPSNWPGHKASLCLCDGQQRVKSITRSPDGDYSDPDADFCPSSYGRHHKGSMSISLGRSIGAVIAPCSNQGPAPKISTARLHRSQHSQTTGSWARGTDGGTGHTEPAVPRNPAPGRTAGSVEMFCRLQTDLSERTLGAETTKGLQLRRWELL